MMGPTGTGLLLPGDVERGYLAVGPPGLAGRWSVMGVVDVGWPRAYQVKVSGQESAALFYYSPDLARFFDPRQGYEPGLAPIGISARDPARALNHSFYILDYVPERWGHAEVPLSALRPGSGTPRLEAGDRIDSIMFVGGFAGGKPFFIDNIKLVSAMPAEESVSQ